MISLEDYYDLVGDKVISTIHKKARKILGRHVLHINSTYQGGGVAEILSSLVPLMNDIGIDAGWRILHGNPDFFTITKKFHNALQGDKINLSDKKKSLYLQTNQDFSVYTHLNHNCIIIHDPQPLPLIKYFTKREPWIWRCHIDISNPNPRLWAFLKKMIIKYDHMIISNENYRKSNCAIDQTVIYPVIDPLSLKNKELGEKTINKFVRKFNIPMDKPVITQISRFDKWKDPLGVLEIFKQVKKSVDCRLILCGSMASDDPEGVKIYDKVKKKAKKYIENGEVILITLDNDILVNVLQRISKVIIQKSLKEGFGLTVTEAMWKKTPVIASKSGGIPLQIDHEVNGLLIDPSDMNGFVQGIIKLLKDQKYAARLGENARAKVSDNFLITRLLEDYLDLITKVLYGF